MFTPTPRCECAQPGLIDTMRKWSIRVYSLNHFKLVMTSTPISWLLWVCAGISVACVPCICRIWFSGLYRCLHTSLMRASPKMCIDVPANLTSYRLLAFVSLCECTGINTLMIRVRIRMLSCRLATRYYILLTRSWPNVFMFRVKNKNVIRPET